MSAEPETRAAAPAGEIDVRYYAGLLWRGRWLIVTAAVVGLALATLVAHLQIPEYRAAAMLQIEPPTPTFLGVNEALMGLSGFYANTDFYNTQFKILRSKPVGEETVKRLKLDDRPPFKDHPDPGALLMAHVTVEPIPESRLVWVQVTHEDPQEAARWANMVSAVYIEQTLENRVESARQALQWLQDRLGDTQRNMTETQERLLKSYERQDLFVPEGSISAVSSSIAKLNEDFVAARARRIELEAVFNQVSDLKRQGKELDAVPQVARDSVVAELSGKITTLRIEMSRLKERFKEGHPEVQKAFAELQQVERARDSRVTEILEGLQAEYNQLQKREAQLQAAIEAQKAQAATQSRKVAELEALKKEADSSKSLYEVLLQKLNETDIAASIRNNNVVLIEKASAPLVPVRPNKQRIALMGLLLGLALGVGLVIGRDFLDNTINDPEEVERFLHVDLLAGVPRYEDASSHLATEAYQNLRTALIFARKDERGQVVLVTGTAPQEGKTTTLVNIGRLLASGGERTLLVDGDLRRAQLHTRLGLQREPGLTDHFVRHEPLEELVRETATPNLWGLTAGALPPNPPALLARRHLGEMLDSLRDRYEWILIDSPPMASVTDALLVARHADNVVFVVQHNRIDKKLIRRSVASLQKATPNLLGVVLNAVDLRAPAYTYGYGYYYYSHDTESGEAGPPRRRPKTVLPRKA